MNKTDRPSGSPHTYPDTTHPETREGGPLAELAVLWRGFDGSSARSKLILLAASVGGVVGLNTFGQIRLNAWQGAFFDAIGRRDVPAFVAQLGVFAILVVGLLILVVAQTWLTEVIKLRLRGLLTHNLLDQWLQPRRAYLLQFSGEVAEHPDQRVHEDARHLAELTTDLGVGLVQSTLLLVSFVGVLWQLSAGMEIWLWGDRPTVIPGYMVWCALAYSVGGSLLTYFVGRPLIRLNIERYEREATLRFALVGVDEAAQSIALYRGEDDERKAAGAALEAALAIGRRLARALARLTWVTSAYGWGTLVAPVLAAAPAYFSGSMSLGGLMMVIGAFGQVQQALRWFVDNFPRIADWRATLRRVWAIQDTLMHIDGPGPGSRIELADDPAGGLVIEALRIDLPDGPATLADTPVTVAPGEHVLIVGEAGSGKSTLFLALGGLWSAGAGRVRMPPRTETMFLPQRPFIPQGTLRQVLTYPSPPAGVPDDRVREVLGGVGLTHLLTELDRSGRWDRDLPLDEQQAIAMGRVLVQKPSWLFMDDAVSAVEEGRRKAILALISSELPGTAVIGTSRSDLRDGFWKRVVYLHSIGEKPRKRSPSVHLPVAEHLQERIYR